MAEARRMGDIMLRTEAAHGKATSLTGSSWRNHSEEQALYQQIEIHDVNRLDCLI